MPKSDAFLVGVRRQHRARPDRSGGDADGFGVDRRPPPASRPPLSAFVVSRSLAEPTGSVASFTRVPR
jgi:hypothetical protein